MKKILDYQKKEVVAVFDEVNLWSAPFGKLLLENIPMKNGMVVVDIGFGTGFPLIELSQRFGESSKVYGIDIWEQGIQRTKEKIEVFGLTNIEIMERSASDILLESNQVDLVTSNLGVNNFEEKNKVYAEIHRILKPGGSLCITTNPIGTFFELFDCFQMVLTALGWKEELKILDVYLQHRGTPETIISEIEAEGLKLANKKQEVTNMRFVNAEALLDHSLIRIGFREYWEKMIPYERATTFFDQLVKSIQTIIESNGTFTMTIPMLYLEFKKP
jgi:arsenite methyltransferase